MPLSSRKRTRLSLDTSRSADDAPWHSTAIGSQPDQAGPSTRPTVPNADNVNGALATASLLLTSDGNEINASPVQITAPSGHPFFASILHKHGFILGKPRNTITSDDMSFRKNLSDWIEQSEKEGERIQSEASKFISAACSYLSNKENLWHAMLLTKHPDQIAQPSLLNLLLGVTSLQPKLLKIVLPALVEASLTSDAKDLELLSKLLQQLKWLPEHSNEDELCERLFEILDNASLEAKKELIYYLPEIITETHHDKIATKLVTVFEATPELEITVLECFSSLDVSPAKWTLMRFSALNKLLEASLKDVPSYLAFLLRSDNCDFLEETISTMRERLDLTPKSQDARNETYLTEIVEKLKFQICVNSAIMSVWTKQLKDDLSADIEVKWIDFLMLTLFHEYYENSVQTFLTLFSVKKKAYKMCEKIISQSKALLFQLFPTLVGLCEQILRNNKIEKCSENVNNVLLICFSGLTRFEAQNIIIAITSVIANGSEASRQNAINLLFLMAEKEPKKLLVFAPHIMGVLEYVLSCPALQIRKLMEVLAILGYTPGNGPEERNSFQPEFCMLLRKLLYHHDQNMQCLGVLSTMATVRQLSLREKPDIEKIKELLQLAWVVVEKEEDACCAFLDEFSNIARYVPIEVCKEYQTLMATKFENLWTIDQASDSQMLKLSEGDEGINLEPTFDGNKEIEREKLIILFEAKPSEMSPACLPSHLRIVTKLEGKVENGNLEGIDAILGCPLFFPKINEYFEQSEMELLSPSKKNALGRYLSIAINFLRECVSGFVDDEDPELRIKIWMRVGNIVTLQRYFVRYFNCFPMVRKAYAGEKQELKTTGYLDNQPGPSKAIKSGRKNKRKKHKPKLRRAAADDTHDTDAEAENTSGPEDDILNITSSNISSLEMQPKYLLPYIRKFEPKVFKLLRYPLSLNVGSVDFNEIMLNLSSATQTRMHEIEQLTPETLIFLLTNLTQLAETSKEFDICQVQDLLAYACKHFNSITAAYGAEGRLSEYLETNLDEALKLLLKTITDYLKPIHAMELTAAEAVEKHLCKIAENSCLLETLESLAPLDIGLVTLTYFGQLRKYIKTPKVAIMLLTLMESVFSLLGKDEEIFSPIDETVRFFLKKQWKLSSSDIEYCLKLWMSSKDRTQSVLRELVENLLHDEDNCQELCNIPYTNVFRSCSKKNFHIWFNAMIGGVAQFVHKNARKRGNYEVTSPIWTASMELLESVISSVHNVFKRTIICPLLKHTRLFIDAFIIGGIPLISYLIKNQTDAAQKLCRNFQNSTRRIQYICEHSKVLKDPWSVKWVPPMKRSLEIVLFKIREVLTSHGAGPAFWMGSLKHKNLDGAIIESQRMIPDESDSNEDSGHVIDILELSTHQPAPSHHRRRRILRELNAQAASDSEKCDESDDDEVNERFPSNLNLSLPSEESEQSGNDPSDTESDEDKLEEPKEDRLVVADDDMNLEEDEENDD